MAPTAPTGATSCFRTARSCLWVLQGPAHPTRDRNRNAEAAVSAMRSRGSGRTQLPAVRARDRRSRFASHRESQGATHLPHPRLAETRDSAADRVLRHGHDVVEVDRTRLLETIVGTDEDFRRDTPNRRGNGCHGDAREVADRRITREDEDRPRLVGWRESDEANFTAFYSSGHAVT